MRVYCAPIFSGSTWSTVAGTQNGQYPWRAFRSTIRNSGQTDQAALYYPWLTLLDRTQDAGVVPWWSASTFGGQPLFSNGQIGMLYPPRVILTALVEPAVVHEVLLMLHLLLAGLFAYLLLVDLGCRWASALFGGTAWMLASFCTGWLQMQVVAPVIYFVPLTLLVVRRVVLRPSTATTFTGAAVVALAIVAGSLAFMCMALLAAALYGLCLAARSFASLRRLALVFALGLGFSAVLLVPTFLTAATSPRDAFSGNTISPGYLAPLRTALRVFEPPPIVMNRALLNELAFVGTATVALAFVGLFRRAPGSWLGRVMVVLVPLVAVGGPVTWVAIRVLPGLREFRPLGRLYMFFAIGVVVLGALGLDLLLGWARRWRGAATVAALALTVVTAVELGTYGHRAGPAFAPRASEYLYPETPLITALRQERPEGGRTPRLAMVDSSGHDGRYRPPTMGLAIPVALGLSTASGEDSIVPARTQALWKLAGGRSYEEATAPSRSGFVARFPAGRLRLHLLERLGVTTVVGAPYLLKDPFWRPDPRRLRLVYSGPDGLAYRVRSPAAATRLVYAADVAGDGEAALRRFADPRYDALRRVVFERAQLARVRGAELPRGGGTGRVLATTETHNTFTARVVTTRAAWLVVPSMWDRGWSARVAGRRVPMLRGNYNQRVVLVPAGASTVELTYRPAGLRAGAATTAATAAGSVLWGVVVQARRRLRDCRTAPAAPRDCVILRRFVRAGARKPSQDHKMWLGGCHEQHERDKTSSRTRRAAGNIAAAVVSARSRTRP